MTIYARVSLIVLFLVAGTLSGGCNIVRITLNTPLTDKDVAFIVPGQTSSAEIIDKFGVPDTLTESATGVVATYRFLELKYSRLNFGLVLKLWSPVDPDLLISRTRFGTDALEVLYDANGIVSQHSFLRHLSDPRFNPYPF
jgi:hypothetical protein